MILQIETDKKFCLGQVNYTHFIAFVFSINQFITWWSLRPLLAILPYILLQCICIRSCYTNSIWVTFPKYLLTLFDNFCLKFMVWVSAGDWLETAWGCWFILRWWLLTHNWHLTERRRERERSACAGCWTPATRPADPRSPLSLYLGPVSGPPLLWAMIKMFKRQSF